MSIFYSKNISDAKIVLTEEEARHCSKVLRKTSGDEIDVIDGSGVIYKAKIVQISKTDVICNIVHQEVWASHHKQSTIGIAPTKNADRIEWFVEKAVEIGIQRIVLFESSRTERTHLKLDRLNKIVVSAMKQSKNIIAPEIIGLVPFDKVLNLEATSKYIAHCNTNNLPHLKSMSTPEHSLLLIGPEGDFTIGEVEMAKQNGFEEVSLGQSRLRTETAALFGLFVLNL